MELASTLTPGQWRRLNGARGHVPPLLQMAGHGGTVSRKTTNKKLTKLHIWPITKALTKTNNLLLEPKKWRGTAKKNLQALRAGPVPPPHFQSRSGATADRL